LLVPIAQTATTWHVLSFACMDVRDAHGKAPYHQSHCDFCLTAAALSGGALSGEAPSSPHPAGRHEVPPALSSSIWSALPAWAYRSRAPPFAPH
jgi:hypothetical protein